VPSIREPQPITEARTMRQQLADLADRGDMPHYAANAVTAAYCLLQALNTDEPNITDHLLHQAVQAAKRVRLAEIAVPHVTIPDTPAAAE